MYPVSVNALSIIRGEAKAEQPAVWTLALTELHSCNTALWNLEESVRKKDIDDASIAAIKRKIDNSNLQRHRAVAELDRLLTEYFTSSIKTGAGTVLNSETMGQMLDRLSVLMLKHKNFSAKNDKDRLARIERHIEHISACFDNAIELINRGALPPGCDEIKDYGDAGS